MRILQIMPTMGHGGIAMMMKMYAEELSKYDVIFDFLHHGHEEEFHKDLRAIGSNFFCLQSPSKVGWNRFSKQFLETISEHGPYDAVHINMNYQSGRYAHMAKKAGIKKRIIHVHGVNFYRNYVKLFMPIIKLDINKYGTDFCADSSQCGCFYFGRRDYCVIPVAIDTSIYKNAFNARNQMREQLHLHENDFAIGHIAAFYEVKNHEFDVKLLKELKKKKNKNYVIFFAGDGPLKKRIEELSHEEKLDGSVRFLGNIDYIPEFLSALDATILPSISEGLGQVLIQSQLAGVPCFASNTLPHESDMKIGLATYLPIDSDDSPEIWAQSIANIGADRLPFDVCKSGVDKAGYSIEIAAKRLLQIYRSKSNG